MTALSWSIFLWGYRHKVVKLYILPNSYLEYYHATTLWNVLPTALYDQTLKHIILILKIIVY